MALTLLAHPDRLRMQAIETDLLDADMSGIGRLEIDAGTAKKQIVSVTGCGSFNGKNLVGETGTVNVSGCGSANVNIH